MRKIVSVLLVVCVCKSAPQDSIQVTEGFHENPGFNGRKVLATGMVCALVATSLVWSYKVWWEDATKPFGFCNEGWFSGKRLGVDKTGHFFASYFFYNTLRNVMLWGGYKRTTANWWAAGATAYFAIAIEIGDGVRRDGIGFDYQDLLFDLVGIGYGWLQTEVPIPGGISILSGVMFRKRVMNSHHILPAHLLACPKCQ